MVGSEEDGKREENGGLHPRFAGVLLIFHQTWENRIDNVSFRRLYVFRVCPESGHEIRIRRRST